jgi:hypothetical protein
MDEFVMAAVIWDEKDPSADHVGIHEDVKHFDNVCAALDWAKDHHMVRTGPTTILITMRD